MKDPSSMKNQNITNEIKSKSRDRCANVNKIKCNLICESNSKKSRKGSTDSKQSISQPSVQKVFDEDTSEQTILDLSSSFKSNHQSKTSEKQGCKNTAAEKETANKTPNKFVTPNKLAAPININKAENTKYLK